MTANLPACVPQCPQHGPMVLRPGYTPEQRWCGVWYACIAYRCRTEHLLASPELLASLAEQRARFEAPAQLTLAVAS